MTTPEIARRLCSRSRGTQTATVKLGYFNRHGWMGYWLDGTFFVKRFDASVDPNRHPDGGCNVESYCNDKFIELETLPADKVGTRRSCFSHGNLGSLYGAGIRINSPEIEAVILNK